jgi:hypothetical protein
MFDCCHKEQRYGLVEWRLKADYDQGDFDKVFCNECLTILKLDFSHFTAAKPFNPEPARVASSLCNESFSNNETAYIEWWREEVRE